MKILKSNYRISICNINLRKLRIHQYTPSKLKFLAPPLCRHYATITEKELEVPTFCDLHIQLPYSLYVKPLNVHKYHNCDKLILKIDKRIEDTLEYDINGNQITIIDIKGKSSNEEDLLLSIKAPIKSNLYIKSKENIKVGYFHGDKLYLKSKNGDIHIDKYQGDVVRLITNSGNIIIKEYMQASDIDAAVLEKGDINAGRFQSLNLKLQTKLGNISVESSYSHDSHFSAIKGNIALHNAHKSCKVFIEEGNLNLTGFDGKIKTVIDKGSANIQLSRITDESEINLMNGSLNLKVSNACQDYTGFRIKTLDWEVPETVKMTARTCEDVLHLMPDVHEENIVNINCMKGSVDVDSASWEDMIKLKLEKTNTQ